MAPDIELTYIASSGGTLSGSSPNRRSKASLIRDNTDVAVRIGRNGSDEALLARLGKRQLLKRNFDFVSMFAFTCIVLVSWEGFYQVLVGPAFLNGGLGSPIFGFVVIFVGTVSTFVSIGELASIAPTAGGQYHWVYMLAPTNCRRLLSYLTGWMTVLSWQALTASSMYGAGSILEGLLIINYPTYIARQWHVLIYNWLWIAIAIAANTVGSVLLPVMECAFLLIHVLGFIAVFIILCYVTPHGDVSKVFRHVNLGNWPTQGISSIVGLTNLAFAFLGADTAIHMSEEVHNASVNVPRSLLVSLVVNGLLGIAVVVPTMFGLAVVDVNAIMSTDTGYPFIPMFASFTGNSEGSTVICSLILALNSACLTSIVTTTSRMIWAFARDRALPFSDFLSKIHGRTSGPLNAVVVTSLISAALSLVNLGATVAFESLVSLGIAGFYSTYLISVGFLLWHRLRGNINEPADIVDDGLAIVDVHSGHLAWGPWRVRGWLGTANNIYACGHLLCIMFFSLWPAQSAPGAKEMNYSVVIVGAVLLCSGAYYFFSARRRYVGPVIEIVI